MPSAGEEASLASLAYDIVEKMEANCLYIIGPGTTTRAIMDELGLPKTLIGVDVVVMEERREDAGGGQARLVAVDASEAQILKLLARHKAKIVVTPIGGQGYILGRGNQQISPEVIERLIGEADDPWQNIIVVSTKEKLNTLGGRPLLVDTGDRAIDEVLSGYVKVVTGYNERAVRKVAC
jgi:predicted polyphosphate/ATP-dependent NAD kinase